MRKMELEDLPQFAKAASGEINRIYLHWSAGRYTPKGVDLTDYHILILSDGRILSRDDYTEVLAHTWRRNTGAIAVSLTGCYGATTNDLGEYAPTNAQIEAMAQVITVLCDALGLPIDYEHVRTHSEQADEDDYGPATTCERWDLWFLKNGDEPGTGGDTLRGKAIFYQQNGV